MTTPHEHPQEQKQPHAEPTLHPIQLALPLSLSPHTTLHIQLTPFTTSTLVLLTTTDPSTSSSISPLGSFVYAMPSRTSSTEVLSTALYTSPSSIDFCTRAAKILAKRTRKPTYVGCSVQFSGSSVEEEVEGMKVAVEGILSTLKNLEDGDSTNGTGAGDKTGVV